MTEDIKYDIGLDPSDFSKEPIKMKQVPAKKKIKDEYGLHLVYNDLKTIVELIYRSIFPPHKKKTWQIWWEYNEEAQFYAQASSREVAEEIADHAETVQLEPYIQKLSVSNLGPVYSSYEEYMVKQGVDQGIAMCIFKGSRIDAFERPRKK